MKLCRLAGLEESPALVADFEALEPKAPSDYRELAAILARNWDASRPRTVGLAGGQGAGKSTLGHLLASACDRLGLRTCVLGIDDFYKTRAERLELAARVHPLFETRGPPGTHDMTLCREAMEALRHPGPTETPRFDKGRDDRSGVQHRDGPFDLIVLEGWCVGARACRESELERPVNALEREHDSDGVWRRAVNEALRESYQPLWRELDQIVFLEVPDLDAVRRWRLEQEESQPPDRRLDRAAIDRFVAHYERITLRMLAQLPEEADWSVRLDRDHRVSGLRRRVPPRRQEQASDVG